MRAISITIEELNTLYFNNPTATARATAKILGCSMYTLKKAVELHGLKFKSDTGGFATKFPQLSDKEWLVNELATKSIRQIAFDLGTTVGNVGDRVARYELSVTNTYRQLTKSKAQHIPHIESAVTEPTNNVVIDSDKLLVDGHVITNLIGQKFNMMKVIKLLGRNAHKVWVWEIECDCGFVRPISAINLKQQQSCGCLLVAPEADLMNQVFDRLTVKQYLGGSKWLCDCECGRKKSVYTDNLLRGASTSCGCFDGQSREPILNADNTIGIPLTRQLIATIDASDYNLISNCRWSTVITKHTYYAANSNLGLMHRVIMDACSNQLIDHIDNNGLNNRRNNLRVADQSLNSHNSRKREGSTSEFRGVSWSKSAQQWSANITKDGKTYHLGNYVYEIDAAIAYDTKAIELYESNARLNIGDKQLI